MFEFRKPKDEELLRYKEIHDYSFHLAEGRKKHSSNEELAEYSGEKRGLFNDDQLLCVLKFHHFDCNIRGNWVKLCGIGGVASPPENRRSGYVGRMLKESLKEMDNRGILISGLWPFSYPYYRRYGWELVSNIKSYTLKPQKLKFTSALKEGQFKPVTEQHHEVLDGIRLQAQSEYDLQVKRSNKWWERIFTEGDKKRFGYLWEEKGEGQGYIIYTGEGEGKDYWNHNLKIRELRAINYKAYKHLLRFIYYHLDNVKEVSYYAPLSDQLINILTDPRIENHQIKPGVMFRIVNVEKLFSQLNYPEYLNTKFTFKVKDEIADWNNCSYLFKISDGNGICKKQKVETVDFTVDINRLTQVLTGFISPEQAVKLNYLKLNNREILKELQAVFPPRQTYFCEFF